MKHNSSHASLVHESQDETYPYTQMQGAPQQNQVAEYIRSQIQHYNDYAARTEDSAKYKAPKSMSYGAAMEVAHTLRSVAKDYEQILQMLQG